MTIPSELLRSIPRDIKLTGAGKFAAVCAVLFLLASVVVSGWLYALTVRGEAQSAEAVFTNAEIVRLSATRGDHPRWSATYRYDVNGRSFEGTARLGRVDRQRVVLGDTLPVWYVPADPQTHWIDGDQPQRVPPAVVPGVFVPMALLGGLLLIQIQREMNLLSNGRAATGVVTGSRKIKGGTHGGHDMQRVMFEYRLLSGGVGKGRFDTRRSAPQAGSEIVLVYDPDNP